MIRNNSAPSVAIVHDWIAGYAGSERVVEQLLTMYPGAPLHLLLDYLPEANRGMLEGHPVVTSFFQRVPLIKKRFRGLLPLFPLAVEQFDLDPYDIVVSSNHAIAKGVLTRADQLHVSYIHSPLRYAWDLHHQYLRESNLTWGLRSVIARMILHYMRLWDFASAQRVDVMVANSRFIAQRIFKTYGREAKVVYPPVNVDRFPLHQDKQDYYVTASRLVPYKKMDVLVEAFRQLQGKQLIVIGDGPMYKSLAATAPPNVTLMGYQPDEVLLEKMQHARAFLFAAEEDFGIIPVEAQACGTPVIAFGRGGSLETVVDGVTGRFFDKQTPESACAAIKAFDKEADRFDPAVIRQHAEQFTPQRFRREFSEIVRQSWEESVARMRPPSNSTPKRTENPKVHDDNTMVNIPTSDEFSPVMCEAIRTDTAELTEE